MRNTESGASYTDVQLSPAQSVPEITQPETDNDEALRAGGPLTPDLRSAAMDTLTPVDWRRFREGGSMPDPRKTVLAHAVEQDAAARKDPTVLVTPGLKRTVTEVLVSFGAIEPAAIQANHPPRQSKPRSISGIQRR